MTARQIRPVSRLRGIRRAVRMARGVIRSLARRSNELSRSAASGYLRLYGILELN